MAYKICLDAGHYGKYNRSTVVPEYYESEMTWKLHRLLKAALEKYGFEVMTTRTDQAKDMDVYYRGYAAKNCDLFLSLHSNACDTEPVDYVVAYRAYDNQNNADTLGLALAKKVAEVMGTKQNPRTTTRKNSSGNEWYGVMRGARAAGCKLYYILEHSFHTNLAATQFLMQDANLQKLAEVEAAVIANYFGVATPSIETKPSTPSQKPTVSGHVADVQRWLNAEYGYNLAVDNSPGPDTKKHLVMALQTELNRQYNRGLAVDGSFGPKTKAAVMYTKRGIKGNITKLVQAALYCKGYDPKGLDGSFGPGMEAAVRKYQADHGLAVDGSAGPETQASLFRG